MKSYLAKLAAYTCACSCLYERCVATPLSYTWAVSAWLPEFDTLLFLESTCAFILTTQESLQKDSTTAGNIVIGMQYRIIF